MKVVVKVVVMRGKVVMVENEEMVVKGMAVMGDGNEEMVVM